MVTRDFTCRDGSGSVTMVIVRPVLEHLGGTSTWRIVEGSSQYAQLRGHGTWTSSGGDPRFRSVLTGIVDFDTVAPTISIALASSQKLRRPRGAYLLRTSFSARDGDGNVVSYRVTASVRGEPLATRRGETTSGQVSLSFPIRPPARSRTVRIAISASDRMENERTISRSLKLPR